MQRSLVGVTALWLAGCAEPPPPPPADVELTILGVGVSSCSDGSDCPPPNPNSGLSHCPNGASCIPHVTHVVTEPPGILCGTSAGETECTHVFPFGTSVHLSAHDAACGITTCVIKPMVAPIGQCEFQLTMTTSYTVGVGCLNP